MGRAIKPNTQWAPTKPVVAGRGYRAHRHAGCVVEWRLTGGKLVQVLVFPVEPARCLFAKTVCLAAL